MDPITTSPQEDISQANISPSLPVKHGRPFVKILMGLVLLGIGVGIGLFLSNYKDKISFLSKQVVATYEDCLDAKGSVIQESYPATCVTRDGTSFTQPLTDEEKQNLQPPDPDDQQIDLFDTTNWKTYINNKNFYSVKIPPEWQPEKGNAGGQYTDEQLQQLDLMFWRKNNSMFSILVLGDCTNLDKCFKEYQMTADNRVGFSGLQYSTNAFKKTQGTYQGVPSIEARSTYGESVNVIKGIFFVYKDKLWLLETQSLPSLKEASQILTTFKFLDN